MQRVGLNPYGIVYTLGLLGGGTARQNPAPLALDGYVNFAIELGAGGVEIDGTMLVAANDGAFARTAARVRDAGMWTVIASSLVAPDHAALFARAPAIGARTVRLALTAVLAGDRAALGDEWPELVARTRSNLAALAARARAVGLELAIENHQDFTSTELMELCDAAGDNVGVCMDTGNPMAVGESCQDFLATVSRRLRHVHLKDYRAQPTSDGYRLIRCPAGDGIVPFADLRASFQALDVTAALECGAHEARHIRFMAPGFWDRYPPHSAARLSACLRTLTARSIPTDADYRTPWERGADGAALLDYERHEIQASIANLIELGYWAS